MGFHVCEYCSEGGFGFGKVGRFSNLSSGDTILDFGDNGLFQINDAVPHYIDYHGWCPPEEFVTAVVTGYEAAMNNKQVSFNRIQSKGVLLPAVKREPVLIGYLTGKLKFKVYDLPENFAQMVNDLIEKSRDGFGKRIQYRSL